MGAQEMLAGAITALADSESGVRMMIGKSTAVAGQVKVGTSTFTPTKWTLQPSVTDADVLLLMQEGSVTAIGLGAAGAGGGMDMGTADTRYVNTAGDTMTGSLTVAPTGAAGLYLQSPLGSVPAIWLRTGSSDRWRISKSSTTEPGGNVGSNLSVVRYSDAGSSIGTALYINRSDGTTTVGGNLVVDPETAASVTIQSWADQASTIFLRTINGARWSIARTGTSESGSNVGSDLVITRYSDAGASLGTPLTISRSTGEVTVAANPATNLGVATKQYADTHRAALEARIDELEAQVRELRTLAGLGGTDG